MLSPIPNLSTPIIISAPISLTTLVGNLSNNPPSTNTLSPSKTGTKIPGIEIWHEQPYRPPFIQNN